VKTRIYIIDFKIWQFIHRPMIMRMW